MASLKCYAILNFSTDIFFWKIGYWKSTPVVVYQLWKSKRGGTPPPPQAERVARSKHGGTGVPEPSGDDCDVGKKTTQLKSNSERRWATQAADHGIRQWKGQLMPLFPWPAPTGRATYRGRQGSRPAPVHVNIPPSTGTWQVLAAVTASLEWLATASGAWTTGEPATQTFPEPDSQSRSCHWSVFAAAHHRPTSGQPLFATFRNKIAEMACHCTSQITCSLF